MSNHHVGYANNVNINWNPCDFQFTFINHTPLPNSENSQEYIIISVSPQLAKQMLQMLPYAIGQYENSFGEINDASVSLSKNEVAKEEV